MKHLKSYENINVSGKYNIGDYVLVKFILNEPISKNDRLISIIDSDNMAIGEIKKISDRGEFPYNVLLDGDYRINMCEKEIVKKLTPEEAKQFYVIKNYNL